MIYLHRCVVCGFKSEDAEILLVCPDCAAPEITNDTPGSERLVQIDEPMADDENGMDEN